jgi:N-acetylmuramoyl-L-alanine amidase
MKITDVTQDLPKHPSKTYATRAISDITHIVVHHSATETGSAEAFARYHVQEQGWPGVGYHYVIGQDGYIKKCHPAEIISYHASGYNSRSLGVCLVGNFDEQKPTRVQLDALIELLKQLMKAYGIRNVIGHREVPHTNKSCPGKNVNMDEIRKKLA